MDTGTASSSKTVVMVAPSMQVSGYVASQAACCITAAPVSDRMCCAAAGSSQLSSPGQVSAATRQVQADAVGADQLLRGRSGSAVRLTRLGAERCDAHMHRLHCYNVLNTASSPVVPSLHMWKRLQSRIDLQRTISAPPSGCSSLGTQGHQALLAKASAGLKAAGASEDGILLLVRRCSRQLSAGSALWLPAHLACCSPAWAGPPELRRSAPASA